METLICLKKTKIGDMTMNNNLAPNNVLVADTWINLLTKIIKESTVLLLKLIIASHTNNDLDHHVIS